MGETVVEHLMRCRITERQARQHLFAGHVRVNGTPATDADTEPPAPDPDAGADKPVVAIYPY